MLSCLQCRYVANTEQSLAVHLADAHAMDMPRAVERARAIAKDQAKVERKGGVRAAVPESLETEPDDGADPDEPAGLAEHERRLLAKKLGVRPSHRLIGELERRAEIIGRRPEEARMPKRTVQEPGRACSYCHRRDGTHAGSCKYDKPGRCACGGFSRHKPDCPKRGTLPTKRRPVTRRSAPLKPVRPTKAETNGHAPTLIREIQTKIAQLEDGIATLKKAAAILEAMEA